MESGIELGRRRQRKGGGREIRKHGEKEKETHTTWGKEH